MDFVAQINSPVLMCQPKSTLRILKMHSATTEKKNDVIATVLRLRSAFVSGAWLIGDDPDG
jgi:hypothetical protein